MKEDGRALIGQLFCFYVPSLSEGDVLIGKLFFIVHTHEEDVTKMIKGVKTYCTMNHLQITDFKLLLTSTHSCYNIYENLM